VLDLISQGIKTFEDMMKMAPKNLIKYIWNMQVQFGEKWADFYCRVMLIGTKDSLSEEVYREEERNYLFLSFKRCKKFGEDNRLEKERVDIMRGMYPDCKKGKNLPVMGMYEMLRVFREQAATGKKAAWYSKMQIRIENLVESVTNRLYPRLHHEVVNDKKEFAKLKKENGADWAEECQRLLAEEAALLDIFARLSEHRLGGRFEAVRSNAGPGLKDYLAMKEKTLEQYEAEKKNR
jgi:hypothetical protein